MNWPTDCLIGSEKVASLQCLPRAFANAVEWLIVFSTTVAMFFIIFAGISYITSGGDQKKIDGAKRTLTYSILGLIVVVLSFLIVRFISYFTKVQCIRTFGFGC